MRSMQETLATILDPPKGVLVADQYAGPSALVDLALDTPALADHVSAVVVTEPTFARRGRRRSGPLVGVRLRPLPSDSYFMSARVAGLARDGAAFVEWRAHRALHEVPPGGVHVEAAALAQGVALAQGMGLLPIVTVAMPDLDTNSIGVSEAVTSNALIAMRNELSRAGVDPGTLLVRINMVLPAHDHPLQADPQEVATATLRVLERGLPSGVAGVLLLSGGQPLPQACANLGAVAALAEERSVPWRLTFGFSRALFEAAATATEDAAGELVQSCRLASESLAGLHVAPA